MSKPIVIALADDIAEELSQSRAYDGLNLLRIATLFERDKQRLGRLVALLSEPMYAGIGSRRLAGGAQPGLRAQRTVLSQVATEAALRRLKPNVRVPSLMGFFALDATALAEPDADALLARLCELKKPDPLTNKADLKTAYFQQEVTTASDKPSHRYADVPRQTYLSATGINLIPATGLTKRSSKPAYDGGGVGFLDIEEGWNVHHEAFDQKVRDCDPGVFGPFAAAHGNAVLGIVLARGPNSKIRGVAPGCTLRDLYALSDETGVKDERVGNAIALATDVLEPGDVILLPLQNYDWHLPIEVSPYVFAAIQEAVEKDIVVVEAAGNTNARLETVGDKKNRAPAWVDDEGIPDSGAIIVGGCEMPDPGKPPLQDKTTCGGARVDCCAWSQGVWTSYSHTTTGYGEFPGTSAASPIIAGLVLVAQQCARKTLQRHLTPAEIRSLLRDPANGTEVTPVYGVPISMPDAAKLCAKIEAGVG